MAHRVRGAGVLSLVGAVAAAATLTGVAFFSIARAGCEDPGAYVHHGDHIELIGGCLNPADLPGLPADPVHEPLNQPANRGSAQLR